MKTLTLVFLTIIAVSLIGFAAHLEATASRLERDMIALQVSLDYAETPWDEMEVER